MDEVAHDKQELKAIFARLNRGELSYAEASRAARPVIDRINKRNCAVTFKLNRKHALFRHPYKETFASLRWSQSLM